MPKLWNATIAAHRQDVRDAVFHTTARLVAEHGLRAVTMSQIASETGIGRATLYKYFPGVEAILRAHHERQVTAHLDELATLADRPGSARTRLQAVLRAYAAIVHSRGRHDAELAAFLHQDGQVAEAEQRLRAIIRNLLSEGAQAGDFRDDIAPEELAGYCVNALRAAKDASSEAALRRLVAVIISGLRPKR